jgi:plasmid stabilization system protein ParE
MVRKVRWSRAAQNHLREILEFISEDAPINASRLAERIKESSESLSALSQRGRIIPDFGDPTLREIFVNKYRIMYEVKASEIVIIAIVHMSRDLQNVFPDI